MFIRAIIAFMALPGMVAFCLPLVFIWHSGLKLVLPAGLLVVVLGTVALVWCVRDFYVSGKGTLAPWSPPQILVTVGLYRYSRNPMYVAVALILLGWTVAFLSFALLIYVLLVVVAFHFRVVYGEEPWLVRTQGSAWREYSQRVRRWF